MHQEVILFSCLFLQCFAFFIQLNTIIESADVISIIALIST